MTVYPAIYPPPAPIDSVGQLADTLPPEAYGAPAGPAPNVMFATALILLFAAFVLRWTRRAQS